MIGPTTLLLDGIWGRPKRLGPLMRLLRQRCGPAEVFPYDATGLRPFEELGAALARAIRHHAADAGPVNVIAFSMGGLVVRAAHLLDPTLPLRRAVFLNSPHRGSLMAYALPLPGLRQMRPGSDLLRRLDSADWNIPTLATWCPLDTMVVPGRSARWPKATQTLRCPMPLHIWPIWSRRIHQKIADFLAASIPLPFSNLLVTRN